MLLKMSEFKFIVFSLPQVCRGFWGAILAVLVFCKQKWKCNYKMKIFTFYGVLCSFASYTNPIHDLLRQFFCFFTPGTRLTSSVIAQIYKKELMSVVETGSFTGIWQFHALARVLNCVDTKPLWHTNWNTTNLTWRWETIGHLRMRSRHVKIMISLVSVL